MTGNTVSHFHRAYALVNSPNIADHHRDTNLERTIGFDNQAFSTLDKTSRAEKFISSLEKKLSFDKGESSLKLLLLRILQISASDENAPAFDEITPAFFKQEGYLRRLFSKESWEQWTENRTPLGKVVSQLRDCTVSHTRVDKFEQSLDKSEIQQANEEAYALLKALDQSRVTPLKTGLSLKDSDFLPRNSCAKGLIGGAAATLATKNPFPLIMGLGACLPKVSAQQKVGSEFQVNTYEFNDQRYPSVAGINNSNFVVTWQSEFQDGTFNSVYGQLFNGTGSKIGSEFQVNTFINTQEYPSVTSLVNGNFVVIWESAFQDGDNDGIFGQLFSSNSTKIGGEFQVNTYTPFFQQLPSVTSFRNGNFVVTWQSWGQDGDSIGVFGQLFYGNTTKKGNEFQVNTYTTSFQARSAVASLGNNFVVTWDSDGQDGDSWGIFGQLFYENTTKKGNEFQVNTYTTSFQTRPAVASLGNNFVATWDSDGQDGSSLGVYGQLFDGNGNKIGNEFQVNTYTIVDQAYSSIVGLSNGNFVVTWKGYFQPVNGIAEYLQMFNGNGTKLGNEFVISYTTNQQGNPSVARLSDGNFVVTWESSGQDSSGYGIYGQILNDIIPSSTISSSSTTSTTSSSSATSTSSTSSTTSTTSSTSLSTISSTTSTISSTRFSSSSPKKSSSFTSTSPDISSPTSTSNTPTRKPPTSSPTSTAPPNVISGAIRETLSASTYLGSSLLWLWFMLRGRRE